MKKKWAQMSKIERAWERLQHQTKSYHYLGGNRSLRTKTEQRMDNRYYQLCKHWVSLKESSTTQS